MLCPQQLPGRDALNHWLVGEGLRWGGHRVGGSREKGTVGIRKEAWRSIRQPSSPPPQLCSATKWGRATPAHGDSTLFLLSERENSLELYCFHTGQLLIQAWLAVGSLFVSISAYPHFPSFFSFAKLDFPLCHLATVALPTGSHLNLFIRAIHLNLFIAMLYLCFSRMPSS